MGGPHSARFYEMYVITIVLGTQKLEKGLMLIMLLRVNIITIVFVEKEVM